MDVASKTTWDTLYHEITGSDKYKILAVCASLIELYASDSICIWKFYATDDISTNGIVSFVAGLNLDGSELEVDTKFNAVQLSEFPTFLSSITHGSGVVLHGDLLDTSLEMQFINESGLITYECEPIMVGETLLGFLMISPPRIFDTDRSALLPSLLAPAIDILSALNKGKYRDDSYFIASMVSQGLRDGSIDNATKTLLRSTMNRLGAKAVSLWLPRSWRTLFFGSDPDSAPNIRKELQGNYSAPTYKLSPIFTIVAKPNDSLLSDPSSPQLELFEQEYISRWIQSSEPLPLAGPKDDSEPLPLAGPKNDVDDLDQTHVFLGCSISINSVVSGVLLYELVNRQEISISDQYLVGEVCYIFDLLIRYYSSAHYGNIALDSNTSLAHNALVTDQSEKVYLSLTQERLSRYFELDNHVGLENSIQPSTGFYALPSVQYAFRHRIACVTPDLWATQGFDLENNANSGEIVQGDPGRAEFVYSNPQILPGPRPVLRSSIAVPIITRRDTRYVALAGHPTKPRQFSPADTNYIDFLSADGSLAALVSDLRRKSDLRSQHFARDLIIDPVTDIANTVLLVDRLDGAMRRAKREQTPIALVLIDIVNFSDINLNLGFQAGNNLLRELANRLRQTLRDCDAISRASEDTFAVILTTGVDQNGIAQVIAKLNNVLSLPFYIDGQPVLLSFYLAPFGWLGTPDDPLEFYNQSYFSLQRAKPDLIPQLQDPATASISTFPAGAASDAAAGRFEQPLGQDRQVTLAEVENAFYANQFYLDYLPQVSLYDKDVITFEALIRWSNPEFGPLAPSYFMHLVEATPLGWEMTRWILHTAMNQCLQWQLAGLTVAVSINISKYDILYSPLIEEVENAIESIRLSPRQLVLEISEEAAQDPMVKGSAVLVMLRTQGVKISIDDCGSGRVAPVYLARMPVDQIKLDNSLLQLTNPYELTLVQDIVRLGHEYGVQIVAEAVEEKAKLDEMVNLGVDAVQGYQISKPLSANDVMRWTTSYRKSVGISGSVDWRG